MSQHMTVQRRMEAGGAYECFSAGLFCGEIEIYKQNILHCRRTRSVSSGDNGIPIIEESYAVHRNPTKNRSVDEHLQQVLQARNVEDPKLNYDWTDKRYV